jgi:DNA-binding transcriptional MocR family regulator
MGLATTMMALLQPGDVVATDALTYPGFKVLAEAHRLELVPIPADGPGARPRCTGALCQQPAGARRLCDADLAQPAGLGDGRRPGGGSWWPSRAGMG